MEMGRLLFQYMKGKQAFDNFIVSFRLLIRMYCYLDLFCLLLIQGVYGIHFMFLMMIINAYLTCFSVLFFSDYISCSITTSERCHRFGRKETERSKC